MTAVRCRERCFLLLYGGAAAVAACDRGAAAGQSVASVAAGLAPFDELANVRLGMTAAELRRARPAARDEAYSGFREDSRRGTIVYGVESPSAAEGMPTPPDSRLGRVAAESRQPSDSAAVALWHRTLTDASARLRGQRPRCARITNPRTPGQEAVWARGDAELAIQVLVMPRRAGRGAQPGDSARVRVVVQLASTSQLQRAPMTCPSL